jgi:uncharacterized membrane protein YhaH (DUF805 family)
MGEKMTLVQSIRHGFQNYANWKGRATRSEYWWWFLFTSVITLPLIVAFQAGYQQAVLTTNDWADVFGPAFWVYLLVSLAVFLPNLAILVRRLHDTDRSGGWYWIGLVPFAGSIILFVFTLLPSSSGRNRFDDGPDSAGRISAVS